MNENNLIPGRKKGAKVGRLKCLGTLDRMLSTAGNQKKLFDSLQRKFNKDPGGFLMRYVYPLLPKNVKLEAEGHLDWNITVHRIGEVMNGDSAEPEVEEEGPRPKPLDPGKEIKSIFNKNKSKRKKA